MLNTAHCYGSCKYISIGTVGVICSLGQSLPGEKFYLTKASSTLKRIKNTYLLMQSEFLISLSVSGSSGIPVKLVTNLFSLGLPREWQLYQYHVEFMPELVSRRLRTALLYSHAEFQGKTKVFDGASLFLTEKLENKVRSCASLKYAGANILVCFVWERVA